MVVGAGLAGLNAARTLRKAGLKPIVLEASDGVGGRVRTDNVDGFLLDRGFQIYLTGGQGSGLQLYSCTAAHVEKSECSSSTRRYTWLVYVYLTAQLNNLFSTAASLSVSSELAAATIPSNVAYATAFESYRSTLYPAMFCFSKLSWANPCTLCCALCCRVS